MAKPATKPAFGAGILSGLRAASGATAGEPLFLNLDQIEEDPDQPRTNFDEGELQQLAETIRLYGVLTPVGVRKIEGDRYRLVYGARRLRASRLAEQTRIPTMILGEDKSSLAVQVIENQARANLSNRDLASVVNRMFSEGMKVKQIAALCSLKEYQIAAFRSVERLPPFLIARLDNSDMRAVYDLFRAWEKAGPVIEAAMPAEDVFLTVTESRRIIEAATGKTTSSVFLGRSKRPAMQPVQSEERPPVLSDAGEDKALRATQIPIKGAMKSFPLSRPVPSASTKPVFIMETNDGRRGVLITDRRAEQSGQVLLTVEGGEVAEVTFSELRPVEVA